MPTARRSVPILAVGNGSACTAADDWPVISRRRNGLRAELPIAPLPIAPLPVELLAIELLAIEPPLIAESLGVGAGSPLAGGPVTPDEDATSPTAWRPAEPGAAADGRAGAKTSAPEPVEGGTTLARPTEATPPEPVEDDAPVARPPAPLAAGQTGACPRVPGSADAAVLIRRATAAVRLATLPSCRRTTGAGGVCADAATVLLVAAGDTDPPERAIEPAEPTEPAVLTEPAVPAAVRRGAGGCSGCARRIASARRSAVTGPGADSGALGVALPVADRTTGEWPVAGAKA